jgi:hypothetical protein
MASDSASTHAPLRSHLRGMTVGFGYYGYQLDSRLLLGIGFIAHGAWDWLHHNDHGFTRVRNWYPPFCAVADVVIGVPLLAEWV